MPIRGADFNAFGYDPDGFLAYFAAEWYGRDYVPEYNVQIFSGYDGITEPPRFGPAAPYQIPILPEHWMPTPPIFFHIFGEPPLSDEFSQPWPARGTFDRNLWDALRIVPKYKDHSKFAFVTVTVDLNHAHLAITVVVYMALAEDESDVETEPDDSAHEEELASRDGVEDGHHGDGHILARRIE
ncbi:hypothetical protein DXG01_015549, partial [Tephrocybe rancida]